MTLSNLRNRFTLPIGALQSSAQNFCTFICSLEIQFNSWGVPFSEQKPTIRSTQSQLLQRPNALHANYITILQHFTPRCRSDVRRRRQRRHLKWQNLAKKQFAPRLPRPIVNRAAAASCTHSSPSSPTVAAIRLNNSNLKFCS